MKSLKFLSTLALLQSFGGIESFIPNCSQNKKPNRISQKKRRINQRRKGR